MDSQALPTAAADVFSFGATMYEAAAGQCLPRELRQGLPSRSPQAEEGGELPFVVELPEGRSRELAVLISLCLSRNPQHRPSAADIDQRAQNMLRGS
jgi:serine/threonine protein kinase